MQIYDIWFKLKDSIKVLLKGIVINKITSSLLGDKSKTKEPLMKIKLTLALLLSLGTIIPTLAMNQNDNNAFLNDDIAFDEAMFRYMNLSANSIAQPLNQTDQKNIDPFQDDTPEFLAALENINISSKTPAPTPIPQSLSADQNIQSQEQHSEALYDELALARSMFTRTLANAPQTPTKKHINAIHGVVDAIQTTLRPHIKITSPLKKHISINSIRPGTNPSKMFHTGTKQIKKIAHKLNISAQAKDLLDTATGRLYNVYTQVPHDQALKTARGTIHQFFQPMNNDNNNNDNGAITNDCNDPSIRELERLNNNNNNATDHVHSDDDTRQKHN